ncbi:DUF4303 domain-containing protein [Paludisphaera mucosa]|uniref:DUF4303 domain-containing protein n=1 Tax=Paludisphaera mucosa TaxID=3030827 RepID=A0ABT6F9L6_9BACT|nr:DUF4303 domain-containing protein [Paludisphaera mucosa]MDG3004283.1 DUF4303 domain-containing protein [Paludisphaera mucosa]
MIGGCGRYDESDDGAFVEYKANVFAAMVLALSDLEAEGFFGSGRDRRSVAVFCSVADSICTAWLEADSARRLNPPEVFEAFQAERIEYISEGADDLAPHDDEVFEEYLVLVRGGRGRLTQTGGVCS